MNPSESNHLYNTTEITQVKIAVTANDQQRLEWLHLLIIFLVFSFLVIVFFCVISVYFVLRLGLLC